MRLPRERQSDKKERMRRTMAAYDSYFLMKEEDVAGYVQARYAGHFAPDAVLTVKEKILMLLTKQLSYISYSYISPTLLYPILKQNKRRYHLLLLNTL